MIDSKENIHWPNGKHGNSYNDGNQSLGNLKTWIPNKNSQKSTWRYKENLVLNKPSPNFNYWLCHFSLWMQNPCTKYKFFPLCLSEKAITFIPKTMLKESNIHMHPSVICVNIWAVINKSSVSKVDVHLESVCRVSDSVYNSWSFPPTSPSQFTAGDTLAFDGFALTEAVVWTKI